MKKDNDLKLDKSDYVMPEVQPAHFTEIQNNLADLHDKLFPDAKHISPDDAQFLRASAKKALKEQKLVSEEEPTKLKELLNKADELILDIHAQITTYSKYTASKVYEWKDLRGKDGSEELREFDDNGRDEE